LIYRPAAVLLFTAVLLTSLGWTTESWAQTQIPRVGILSFFPVTPNDPMLRQWLEPFRRTLAEQRWIEGKNIAFEYRTGQNDPSELAEAAAELVRLNVDVIFAESAPAVRAAHAVTRTVPIVAIDFTSDPVAEGYAESYGRPGGNITGVFLDAPEFAGKWLQLLKAIVPGLSRVAVLWDPGPGSAHLQAVQKFARSFRIQLQVVEVRKPDDLDRAFSAFRGKPQAVIILPSPMIYLQSEQLAKLAMKHRLPATSMARRFAEAGGTVAYGPERISVNERCAVLVAKILGGAKPAELPLERPTKVQLIVNLKTAKALGLTVPESVLYRADEVIR
jgi:putative tryptophan/tyrosine transport system substrate-binding protein